VYEFSYFANGPYNKSWMSSGVPKKMNRDGIAPHHAVVRTFISVRRGLAGSCVMRLRAIITPRSIVYIPLPVSVSELTRPLNKKLTRCSFLHVVAERGWPLLLWLSAEGRALSGSVR
jgi:hypothetical protein